MTEQAPDQLSRPFHHVPVMAAEIIDVFSSVPAGVLLDATLGGAGHASMLLDARPDLHLLGLDRDQEALTAAEMRLAPYGDRVRTVRSRFDDLDSVMQALKLDHLSGALFDLGVSSTQLDVAERGFSYRHDGPLDMRMDDRQSWNASDVVNGYDAARLARVLADHGDERFSHRIAAAIVAARPIESTTRLAEVVVSAIPAPARRTGGHPAKRTFQALRIEVNGEAEALAPALNSAMRASVPGGRVAVLSYHSGEDRVVKEQMRLAEAGGCECAPELPCVCDSVQTVRILRGVPRTPSPAELESNPRASSARLRVVERVADRPRRGREAGAGFGRVTRKRRGRG